MKYNLEQLDSIFNKYINFVDTLKFNYDDKIKNLLYLIIPGFVLRYGINNEKVILDSFREIHITTSNQLDEFVNAYYTATPRYIGKEIVLNKGITIKEINDLNMISLLDSLIHEFNHAINSYNNSIKITDKNIYIRTGLCHFVYEKNTLNFINKEYAYILEEVLNTKQTEEIIDIIHSFKNYRFNNPKINTAIYILDNHIKSSYESKAYRLENFFLEKLIDNKTFYTTLSVLRIQGEVDEIETWFNDITGKKNSYHDLIEILYKLSTLKSKKFKFKFLEKRWKENINDLYQKELEIINLFNRNCNVK